MEKHFYLKYMLPQKIACDDDIRAQLKEKVVNSSVSALAKTTGVPYLLIYNLVHKRVRSLSGRHYKALFGKDPPIQLQKKIDGTCFRKMVDLWLFLNDGITKADLYREFYGPTHTKKVDYRLFTGETNLVDLDLLEFMENKFYDAGITPDTLQNWLDEFDQIAKHPDVPFERAGPLLSYLDEAVGVNPTTLLNQSLHRYQTGELKHISRKVYNRIVHLKTMAEQAIAEKSQLKIEKLKEEIYGQKPGYTLYFEIERELKFLQQYAGKSPKKYLGRSTSMYVKGQCKRLPSWRAEKILEDCRAFIRTAPHLALPALPTSMRETIIEPFLSALKARIADLLSQTDGVRLEKLILRPSYADDEYQKNTYGFTRFDMAYHALGMKKAAFDLMVSRNCEIFRKIGTYKGNWYLSDLYLKELSKKRNFSLISVKYNWLARKIDLSKALHVCLNA